MVALHSVYFFAICTLFQAASGSALVLDDSDNLGIIGGHKVSIEEVPYIAALFQSKNGYNYKSICGGSIIHESFVLTAAHCIIGNHSIGVISRLVKVGSESLTSSSGIQIVVEKEICHEEYQTQDLYSINDICLLKLRRPIRFGRKVAQIELPDEDFNLEEDTLVNVTGWGDTSNGDSSEVVRDVRQVTLPMVSTENCREIYPKLRDTTICAGSQGLDSCRGDSGGPLTYNDLLIGVVSFGPVICGYYPGIYTRVASYLDWIDDNINENL